MARTVLKPTARCVLSTLSVRSLTRVRSKTARQEAVKLLIALNGSLQRIARTKDSAVTLAPIHLVALGALKPTVQCVLSTQNVIKLTNALKQPATEKVVKPSSVPKPSR